MIQLSTALAQGRKRWIFLLLAVTGLYILIPQLGIFRHSWTAVGEARPDDLLIAVGFTAATYLAAAATYCLLAHRTLRYGRTLLVQLASMFVNRLLPAGIGGIGTNYAYLRKAKHSPPQAASVVAANSLLGFVGHMLLTGVVLLLFHSRLSALHLPHSSLGKTDWSVMLLVLAVVVILLVASSFRRRLQHSASGVFRQLLEYRKRTGRLTGALLTSICLTLCNILSLYYCALALHLGLSFVTIVLVFTLGIALGTATPTPGGLGGVEAGLVAGMVAYHVPSAIALATALAYRLISYWLPLAVGGVAFIFAQHQGYFKIPPSRKARTV